MANSNQNVRKYSFNVLFDVLINKLLLNNAINDCFDKYEIDDENKAFIKRECTGVIENIEYIDSVINKYSKVKTTKLDNDILIVLRIAVYELFYMDKVPIYATINESVNLIKKSKNFRLSGYTNAILRNIVRNEKITKNETPKETKNKRCYFRIFGDSEKSVINELNTKNIFYKQYDGDLKFEYSKIYYTNSYKTIITLDSFKNGNIIIEDASSVYLVDKLKLYIDEKYDVNKIKILDTCSAPGGKILSLMDLLRDRDIIAVSRDLTEDKVSIIKENIERLKINSINVEIKDATILDNNDIDKYEVVLCDVPCTGLGVVNKKPDILLNYNDEKRNSLVDIQKKILDTSKKYVKNGGLLSYSTCTTTKEENEENVNRFLSENSNFKSIFEKRIELNDENLSDGFYINIMERND